MLRHVVRGASWVAVVLLVGAVSSLATAGNTDPPAGSISGTMKTLDEVEPRVPIGVDTTPGDADSTFRILSPGSYYLVANLDGEVGKAGIEIAAEHVTIDLMGHSVRGVVGSLSGITVDGTRNGLVVRGGHVYGWGSHGVDLTLVGIGEGVVIEGIIASDNTGDGFRAPFSSVIRACQSLRNSGDGIEVGPNCVVEGCQADHNTGTGIYAGAACRVVGCSSHLNSLDGIQVGAACLVRDCVSGRNTEDGIVSSSDGLIIGNVCDDNDAAGIHCLSGDTRVDGNSVTDNAIGIDVDMAGNVIVRNMAAGNAVSFDIVASNDVAPIESAATATSALANIDY